MAKYAIVNQGIVVNIAESDSALFGNWIPCDGTPAYIGGQYDGAAGTFLPPPVIEPHVPTNRERQIEIENEIDGMEFEDKVGRGVRESLIAMTLIIAQSQGHDEAWLIQNNIAYRKFKERDEQIRALRAQWLLLNG